MKQKKTQVRNVVKRDKECGEIIFEVEKDGCMKYYQHKQA